MKNNGGGGKSQEKNFSKLHNVKLCKRTRQPRRETINVICEDENKIFVFHFSLAQGNDEFISIADRILEFVFNY